MRVWADFAEICVADLGEVGLQKRHVHSPSGHPPSTTMLIGIFADSHDHLDHIRRAVEVFNDAGCELVVFAGDLVSSFAVPPLRALKCPVIACFGDNEGNKTGVAAGMKIIGTLGEPPFGFKTADGKRVLLTHMDRSLRDVGGEFDVAIYAHTHKPSITHDEQGRLFINPGETSGWSYGKPSVALLDTCTMEARIVWLTEPNAVRIQP